MKKMIGVILIICLVPILGCGDANETEKHTIGKKIDQAIATSQEMTGQVVETTKEKTTVAAEVMTNKLNGIVDAVKKKTGEIVETVAEISKKTGETVEKKTRQIVDTIKKETEETMDSVRE